MDRTSSKHSPRVDDELKHETESLLKGAPIESHREEFREHEPSADDEPVAAEVTAPADELGPDAAAARAELSRHLRPSVFPADRDALLAEARGANAPEPVVRRLEELPSGREFATVYEVWEALGGSVERVEGRPHR